MNNVKNIKLMALAMSFLFVCQVNAQTKKSESKKILPPKTSEELVNKDQKKPSVESSEKEKVKSEEASVEESETSSNIGVAPRSLQKHGIGLGIGETFLMGDYGQAGQDKITTDLFYTYTASYSFDVLVNAHYSEHRDNDERMKVRGLNGSVKSRLYEFDNFSPYILGGLGFYAPQAKRKDEHYKWSDSKLTFGVNMGAGLDLRVNPQYTFGVMGQLHWPFNVQQEDQSKLTGYYFKLLITGMYFFE